MPSWLKKHPFYQKLSGASHDSDSSFFKTVLGALFSQFQRLMILNHLSIKRTNFGSWKQFWKRKNLYHERHTDLKFYNFSLNPFGVFLFLLLFHLYSLLFSRLNSVCVFTLLMFFNFVKIWNSRKLKIFFSAYNS